ncbi:hypothetical protein ABZ639_26970 [Saccharomonospora sp. NPDC006951]
MTSLMWARQMLCESGEVAVQVRDGVAMIRTPRGELVRMSFNELQSFATLIQEGVVELAKPTPARRDPRKPRKR